MASNLSRFQQWAKRLASAVGSPRAKAITLETEHVLVIRRSKSVRGWCAECGRVVDMVSLADAALISGVPSREWHESKQDSSWHVIEPGDGPLLVCLDSLLNSK